MLIGEKSQNQSPENPAIKVVSIYTTGTLTPKTIAEQVARLSKAFPDLPTSFFVLLNERLRANGFTDQRLIDAVNNVIDKCTYPKPTIAQIISYDLTKEVDLHPSRIKIKS